MAKGVAAPERGTMAASAANLRRKKPAGGQNTGGPIGGVSGTMLNFYNNDTPGIKMGPLGVFGISIGFIVFVAMLHIVGKMFFNSNDH